MFKYLSAVSSLFMPFHHIYGCYNVITSCLSNSSFDSDGMRQPYTFTQMYRDTNTRTYKMETHADTRTCTCTTIWKEGRWDGMMTITYKGWFLFCQIINVYDPKYENLAAFWAHGSDKIIKSWLYLTSWSSQHKESCYLYSAPVDSIFTDFLVPEIL